MRNSFTKILDRSQIQGQTLSELATRHCEGARGTISVGKGKESFRLCAGTGSTGNSLDDEEIKLPYFKYTYSCVLLM